MMNRNLFAELEEGFDALAAERSGRVTLPSVEIYILDEWLREQVVPAYDAIKADPKRAVSIEEVRARIAREDEAVRATLPRPDDEKK